MSTPVRADAPKAAPLTAREEQILALIARGKSNTEIANELGIAFPTAKAHVSHILAKLGVETREEAARWWDTHAEPERPSVFARWVRLLWPLPATALGMVAGTAALVAVAVLGFFALASLLSGGEVPADPTPGEAWPTPPADESPTSEPSSTTGEGSLAPGLEELGIRELKGAFVRETFPPGTPITQNSGAFFVDTETGEIERVDVDPSAFADGGGIGLHIESVSGDDMLLVGQGILAGEGPPGHIILVDRKNDHVLAWRRTERWNQRVFVTATRDAILLADAGPGGSQPRLYVIDRDFVDIRTVELPSPVAVDESAVLDDSLVALVLLPWSAPDQSQVVLIDTSSATLTPIESAWPSIEGFTGPQLAIEDTANDLIAVTGTYGTTDQSGGTIVVSAQTVILQIYDRSGQLVQEFAAEDFPAYWEVRLSPDGGRIAWNGLIRHIPATGPAGGELWPVVVVADVESGQLLFRVKGATMTYGDFLAGPRWLADGSGLIVNGEAIMRSDGKDTDLSRASYVASSDGGSLDVLTDGVPWPGFGLVPAPGDTDLFALGRDGFWDRARQSVVRVGGEARFLQGHVDPWGADSDEFRIARPHGGHGGGSYTQPVPPILEQLPFDDRLRFVVSADEDCLNLRSAPVGLARIFGDEGTIVDCLPSGAILELIDDPRLDEAVAGGYRAALPGGEEVIYWLHVRTPDGQTGWVASDFLRWATPADG